VPVGGTAADLEAAGQQPLALEADFNTAFHHGVDVEQPFPDVLFGAGGALVNKHDLADPQGGNPAMLEQFGGGSERQWQFLLGFIEFLYGRILLALADNEAAAHREERGVVEDLAGVVGNRELHAVRVARQDGERVQDHVLHHVGQGHRTGQPEGSGVGDGGQPVFHFLGEDQVRVEAFEPEQDGGRCAVAVAGCGQRTVEVHPHGPHSVELSRGLEFLGKDRGGPHGAHCV